MGPTQVLAASQRTCPKRKLTRGNSPGRDWTVPQTESLPQSRRASLTLTPDRPQRTQDM